MYCIGNRARTLRKAHIYLAVEYMFADNLDWRALGAVAGSRLASVVAFSRDARDSAKSTATFVASSVGVFMSRSTS
jgi:hypothetical protein